VSELTIHGEAFSVVHEGALWHERERMLIVADLHFEKGSAFAERGRGLLPPYDTRATLLRLGALISRLDPKRVVALGDSFHDSRAGGRIDATDAGNLRVLQRGRDWLWVAGNHDPDAPEGIEGDWLAEHRFGAVVLRHEPSTAAAPGEIAGHLHPVAKIRMRGESVRRRCVASDGVRAVLPAFGAYAGGLNVLDRAFDALFARGALNAWMLGAGRVHRMPESRLVADL
jgi:DNA ligase-associated metallophosphoesterase